MDNAMLAGGFVIAFATSTLVLCRKGKKTAPIPVKEAWKVSRSASSNEGDMSKKAPWNGLCPQQNDAHLHPMTPDGKKKIDGKTAADDPGCTLLLVDDNVFGAEQKVLEKGEKVAASSQKDQPTAGAGPVSEKPNAEIILPQSAPSSAPVIPQEDSRAGKRPDSPIVRKGRSPDRDRDRDVDYGRDRRSRDKQEDCGCKKRSEKSRSSEKEYTTGYDYDDSLRHLRSKKDGRRSDKKKYPRKEEDEKEDPIKENKMYEKVPVSQDAKAVYAKEDKKKEKEERSPKSPIKKEEKKVEKVEKKKEEKSDAEKEEQKLDATQNDD